MTTLLPDSLLRGLATAALEPGLRQVLLFDADFTLLETAVSLLRQMLAHTTQQDVQVVPLTGLAQEDDLWGSYAPVAPPADPTTPHSSLTIRWQNGRLTQNRDTDAWLLIVIPDLTRLNLAATRAATTLLDAPIAHLERHSHHAAWQPRLCWLAACDQQQIGKLSPHLLDRFTLRLTAPDKRPLRTTSDLHQWLQNTTQPLAPIEPSVTLPEPWSTQLTNPPPLPHSSPEAIQRSLQYSFVGNHPGVRRDLALMRLGRAAARLAGATTILPRHIDEAATLIGLTISQVEPTTPDPELPSPEPSTTESELPPIEPIPQPTHTEAHPPAEPTPIIKPTDSETLPASPLPPANPYPEDEAPVDRELFTLQLPLRRQRAAAAAYGTIIGTQAASSLQDLALIPTILEAAPYQTLRRQHQPNQANQLILAPSDLRRYRRLPQPEKMLLLLLDYTSLQDCQWQQALIPHLRWAYVVRASITVVQVGSSRTPDELRAHKVAARSLLTPRIAATLEPQRGRATPLAHGLEIAYQVIQQAQEHGRSLIHETRFVIITDGRGNVPLTASHSGHVHMPVNREGIDDALQIAQNFSTIKGLYSYLLDPQPQYHAELPLALAQTLAAHHEPIPLVAEAQL